ncbi:mediator of RNA polymerase II transcription subunit isoform X2 [Wolffia australiana]
MPAVCSRGGRFDASTPSRSPEFWLLQESGVLDGSVESSGNSWSLQLPLVCPDGAVVGYAWRRQLAGQAGTSAVDRTRLALKTFHDQKRRYFPHLEEDEPVYQPSPDEIRVPKKLRSYATNSISTGILPEGSTLFDILVEFSREIPGVRISTYRRMEWLGRASSQSLSEDGEQFGHNSDMYSGGSLDAAASGQAVVIELLAPSVFRAILSLHPAGSTIPDAVSFFSPDEWGNHVNARGVSSYQVYRYITEHAGKTLQCFLSSDPDIALHCLLRWVSSYQALFSETCRKCKKLLSNDRNLNLILPPVLRPCRKLDTSVALDEKRSGVPAYHVGCDNNEV